MTTKKPTFKQRVMYKLAKILNEMTAKTINKQFSMQLANLQILLHLLSI